jgi:hypothetical protein
LISALRNPTGIAVDASSIYWANRGTTSLNQHTDGALLKLTPK